MEGVLKRRRGKPVFCYDGDVISSPALIIALYHDDNQYVLKIKRLSGEKGGDRGKMLYFSTLPQALKKVYDILVKEGLKRKEGSAIDRIRDAVQEAESRFLDAIMKLTGDKRIARIAESLKD